MRHARVLWHLGLADFRERTRRYSFLGVLGLAAYLGYTVHTGEFSLKLGAYQGLNNSAWVGAQMTLVLTFILGLFGFYLVKNSVERDARTGVGQIIAATPLSRPAYLAGKWLSNFMVLGVIVVLLAFAALVMQLLHHEAPVDAWALLSPFVIVALPAIALVAGVAVAFEAIPWLRGGLGNLVYFFAWTILIGVMIDGFLDTQHTSAPFTDPLGLSTLIPPMQATLRAVHPDYVDGFSLSVTPGWQPRWFEWGGVAWTAATVLRQWAWAALGLALALGSALFFDRFDATRAPVWKTRGRKPQATPEADEPLVRAPAAAPVTLTPLTGRARATFARVYLAELRLLLQGWPWWWYAAALGMAVAAAFSPASVSREWLLAVSWLWPVLAWSGMGCREERHVTWQMVFSTARPVLRQLPAAWLAGASVAAVAGLGAALAFARAGDGAALAGWAAGVVFIPSLALALGVWTRTSRVFEIVYLLFWYLGAIQHFPALDFTTRPIYAAVGVVLFAVAAVGWQTRLDR